MSYFLHMLIEHFVSLDRAPQAEVRFPASQFLVQPIPHFFPWPHIAGLEMLSHFLFDPVHALLRRTTSDVLPPRAPAEVRPECITQKLEPLLPAFRMLVFRSLSVSPIRVSVACAQPSASFAFPRLRITKSSAYDTIRA